MPVYRYKLTGINVDRLKAVAPPGVSIVAGDIAASVIWDITADASAKDDLDAAMDMFGWTYVTTDPVDTPVEEAAEENLHAPEHLTGQDDEMDGDKLDVDYTPTNYTPDDSPAEADHLDNLTSHLKGIDDALSTAGHSHANKAELDLVTDGDHDVRTDNPHGVTRAQIGLPQSHLEGLGVSWVSTTQVQIAAGSCRDDADSDDIIVSSTLTATITATGANGRNSDTAEQSEKWYAVFVIMKSSDSTVAAFLINEDDLATFTWPTDYDKKRRVGWVRNDGSSNLRKFRQQGNGLDRQYHYVSVDRDDLYVVLDGTQTAWGSGSASPTDCSEFVPPDCTYAYVRADLWGDRENYIEYRPYDATDNNDPAYYMDIDCVFGDDTEVHMMHWMHLDSNQQMDYRINTATGSNCDFTILGFMDSL
jgi:hypothetical protein